MPKVVIGLSGGMDSSTLVGHFASQGLEVYCMTFMYGSKHMPWEVEAAKKIAEYYTPGMGMIDLRQPFRLLKSSLLSHGEDIPEGHYNDPAMSKTVVPGRNLVIASLLAAYAESFGAEAIALGVHSGDREVYPDCRPEFIHALMDTIHLSTEGKVQVMTPFLDMDKYGILKLGYGLRKPVPYELTRTCYKNQPIACGKCGACVERLEAFEKLGIKDPIEYE